MAELVTPTADDPLRLTVSGWSPIGHGFRARPLFLRQDLREAILSGLNGVVYFTIKDSCLDHRQPGAVGVVEQVIVLQAVRRATKRHRQRIDGQARISLEV